MKKNIGRNDLCPCNSGKKYKKCCINKTPATNPSNFSDKFIAAQDAHSKGLYELASHQYKEILSINTNHAHSLHYLGLCEVQIGKFSDGMKMIQRSIELQPNDSTYLSNYGVLLLEQDELTEAEICFLRAIKIEPDNILAKCNLSFVLIRQKRFLTAKTILEQLRDAHPNDPMILSLYASVLAGLEQWADSATTYESALKLNPDDIKTNIDYCNVLKMINKDETISHVYNKLMRLYPDNSEILLEHANYCESTNQLDQAEHYLSLADNIKDINEAVLFYEKGKLCRRRKELEHALMWLKKVDTNKLNQQQKTSYFFELGRSYDKLGMFNEAFSAFKEANKLKLQIDDLQDSTEINDNVTEKRNIVFTKSNLESWSTSSPNRTNLGPEPIFIIGFPRSGSTLIEQIIASHKNIAAGGEYTFIRDIQESVADIFVTTKKYPEVMLDFNNEKSLLKLKNKYIKKITEFNPELNGKYWVTDKRLLNSLEIEFLHLLFPKSPILHAVRHPLDVCLSSYFSNFDTHAYTNDLEKSAHKFVQVINHIKHVKEQANLNYKIIRYEDLVNRPEDNVKSLLEFIDEPWDKNCMNFYKNKRIARTASYAQVSQPLYTSSLNRYKNYQEQIKRIIPILEPTIYELGYEI